jgi:hypothetical protein
MTFHVRPLNPLLSRFPLPMSEDEAKREGRRARRYAQQLPDGHPYAAAPTWLPLQAALRIERLRLVLTGRRPAGVFVERRRRSATRPPRE